MSDAPKLDVQTLVQALDVLNDGIAIYDGDERPILLNSTTQRRFGSIYDEMKAESISYREAIARRIRRGQPDASEADIQRWTDKFHAYFHTGETYVNQADDGRLVKITFREMPNGMRAAISVDVTEEIERERELKNARKAAEAASESKSAFLANMSHEIRTPLNGIMGMAQVMSATELSDQQREYMSTILESGKTLMALLNDVLDLSKIEAGKLDISPVDADLHHILRRIRNLWRPRAEEKGLDLRLALDCDLPTFINFDPVRLQQCISNLVSNAIKFTAKGRVDIFASARSHEDGGHLIEIRVADTGSGMDEETLGRLFQPFAQADETISRKHGGTGLGLSITRRLAEMMGGSATATSEVGRGSEFVVTFRAGPASATPRRRSVDQTASESEQRQQLKTSNLRVLLVDDHPINRQVATLFLRPFNLRIAEATNGREAIEALKQEPFDVVLLDMHMPVMDGPTTIKAIRECEEDWKDIPVIALTADAMSGDKERYMAMGMDGYLSKPLAERDLISEILRVVAGGADQQLGGRRAADRRAG